MSVTCAVCKKTPIPCDSQSFHKFPNKSDLKQKWMEILGVTTVKSSWRVCSDHFSATSFHQQTGYNNRKRRVLPNALPNKPPNTCSGLLSDISNVDFQDIAKRTQDFLDCNSTQVVDASNPANGTLEDDNSIGSDSGEDRRMPSAAEEEYSASTTEPLSQSPLTASVEQGRTEENPSHARKENHNSIGSDSGEDRRLPSAAEEECSASSTKPLSQSPFTASVEQGRNEENPSHARKENASANLKRKRLDNDTLMRRNKKTCFKDGYTMQCISRSYFVNDQAWNKFLRYTILKDNLLKSYRKKNLRKDKKIRSFKELMTALKEKQHSSVTQYLQELPEHVKELISRMKDKKPTAAFPAYLKNFAKTLHFYSPAAFEMVRKSFAKCLPCVETLNSWDCSKNYKPGICHDVIDHVSELVSSEKERGKKLIFNVTFDEMSIKQWTSYCNKSHEWKGLVDLGGQLEEVDKNGKGLQASKALVFMLVNINGGFKTPVAYYLSNSLSGVEKSILLKDLLVKLNEKNVDVVSVCFDGDDSNQKACKELGANFDYGSRDSFRPFFDHPSTSKPVYVFFDPCHMLKLVRNYFALEGPIIYNNTEVIDWDYISKLNDTQYHEGIHCACKIKNRHVNFHNEKMKVYPAAQVLSNSTSSALNFLENNVKDDKFLGSSATAQFCKIFNDIFDALNTKNLFCKTPGRRAIRRKNLADLKTKIESWISYIENLEIEVKTVVKGSKISKTENKENCSPGCVNTDSVKISRKSVITAPQVRTGFVGFIICLRNLYSLCETLFEENVIDYFLSYKISQDHVEMFFAIIRRMNGYSNNPTTVQFMSAFKKLLRNKIDVSVPRSANCVPQDNTFLISEASDKQLKDQSKPVQRNEGTEKKSVKVAPRKRRNVKLTKHQSFPTKEFLHRNYKIAEHDYSNASGWVLGEYQDHVINHVAGAVVYSIRKCIHCEKCLDMLNGKVTEVSALTKLKNRGGLNFASDDVTLICHHAEKVIRQYKDCLVTKDINFKLVTETLKMLPPSILDQDDHSLDQEPMYDHRYQLIYLIVQNYIDKRLKYEGDKLCDIKNRIRMQYNKLTIFKGE